MFVCSLRSTKLFIRRRWNFRELLRTPPPLPLSLSGRFLCAFSGTGEYLSWFKKWILDKFLLQKNRVKKIWFKIHCIEKLYLKYIVAIIFFLEILPSINLNRLRWNFGELDRDYRKEYYWKRIYQELGYRGIGRNWEKEKYDFLGATPGTTSNIINFNHVFELLCILVIYEAEYDISSVDILFINSQNHSFL